MMIVVDETWQPARGEDMKRVFFRLAAAAAILVILAGACERAAGQGVYSPVRRRAAFRVGYRPSVSLMQLALVIERAEDPVVAKLAYARALQLDPYAPEVRAAMARRLGQSAAAPVQPALGQPVAAAGAGGYAAAGPGPMGLGPRPAVGGPIVRGASVLGQSARRLGVQLRSLRWQISRLKYSLRQRPRGPARQSYYLRYTWQGGLWWPRAEPMGILPYGYGPMPVYPWPGPGVRVGWGGPGWSLRLRSDWSRPWGYGRAWGGTGMIVRIGR